MFEERCFHCDLPVYNKNFSIVINDVLRLMCCPGCLAVSRFILDSGLDDFYSFRDKPGYTIGDKFFKDAFALELYNEKTMQEQFVVDNADNASSVVLAVEGITCAACTWLIERHLGGVNGIKKVSVNLSTCRVFIVFDASFVSLSFILVEFRNIGYIAFPYNPKEQEVVIKNEYRRELKKLIISGIGMLQVMMLSVGLYIGESRDMRQEYWVFIRWVSFFLTCPVLFFSARGIFYNAIRGLKMRSFGMDTTVSLSLVIAFFFSVINLLFGSGDVYFDSICMFVFFLLLGRFLEMRARHYSGEIIYSLQELCSNMARLLENFDSLRKESLVSVGSLKVGDYVAVKAGEHIPVDGKIVEGSSSVNESMLTGESIPVYKKSCDHVMAGTVNVDNNFIMEVIKTKGMSTIDVMIQLLEKAGSVKPGINVIANMISGYFVLVVLFLTTVVSLTWVLFGNDNVLNIVLSMLVVACPCALSLATPVAVTSSVNALANKGYLIIKEHVLEQLSVITDVVFDKTGTLTVNNFFINKIVLIENMTFRKVLSLAAFLEVGSKHPIAKAFVETKISFNKISYSECRVKNFLNQGVEGVASNVTYRLGKPGFIKDWTERYVSVDALSEGIWIVLANKKNVLAWFNLVNPVRAGLEECMDKLREKSINLHILSGDSSSSVDHIADKFYIKNRKKNISTEEKAKYIKGLMLNNAVVMMVGDGINDTLALSSAHISVAMGSAVDLAKVSADSILLNNNLTNIYASIKHGCKNKNIIKQNVAWAIFYNISGLTLAGLDFLTPYYAAVGMSASSLVVIFNSLRLKTVENVYRK